MDVSKTNMLERSKGRKRTDRKKITLTPLAEPTTQKCTLNSKQQLSPLCCYYYQVYFVFKYL